MFRGRGRGVTTVVVTTHQPAPTPVVVAAAPPSSHAPPSTTAAPTAYAGPRYHLEYMHYDQFEKVWDDRHTGADPFDGSFFHPIAPAGFYALGSVAVRGQVDYPHGVRALVVREPQAQPGQAHPLLAAPASFTKIWEDKGTGGRYGDCSFWWPNAPAGYVSVGVVAVKGYNSPHPDLVRCVHISAAVPAAAHPEADGHFIWCDRKSRAKFGDVSVWSLQHIPGSVATGTFVCANNYSVPVANFFTVSENPRGPVSLPPPSTTVVVTKTPAPAPAPVTVVHTAPAPCYAPPPTQYSAPPPTQYSAPPPTQYSAPPPAQYGAPPPSYSSAPPSTTAYYPPPSGGGHPPPPSAVPYAQPPQQHTTVVVQQQPPQHHHQPTVVVAQPAHHHHQPTVVVAQPAHHHHHQPTVVVAQPAHHHHDATVVVSGGGRGGIFGRGRGTTVVTIDKHR